MKNGMFRGVQLVVAAAFGLVGTVGCAMDVEPEETEPAGSVVRTLTKDYGDVLVRGVQFSNGDNVSKVYADESTTRPLATWQFRQNLGKAAWEAKGMIGETYDTPLSESLEEANWMAYTVWAAANDVAIDESVGMEGCSCQPCWIEPETVGPSAPGVCCSWSF